VRLDVTHLTGYRYDGDVSESHMEVRLRPASGDGQRVRSHQLEVRPPAQLRGYVDGFGNQVQYFNVMPPHRELEVVSRTVVDTGVARPEPPADLLEPVQSDLLLFRAPVMSTAAVRRLARQGREWDPDSPAEVAEALRRIMGTIERQFTYSPAVTTVTTNVDEVLRLRRGVCQDFAHLFIAAARSAGAPCRYVSGYVYTGEGERTVGASHAWAEAWIPRRGWTAYDPTHTDLGAERYVRLAVGRDYRDAAPTRGVYLGSARGDMMVRVEIQPVET
jgi:transglutaminase-like putative cysteine protease